MQVLKIDQLVGQQVGGYRIERLLGRGHLNVSYLVRHPHTGEMILSIFTVQEQFSSQARQRFLLRFAGEAPALTALRHPHLLPVYDYGERLGYPYLVTPFVGGGSLADILKRQGRWTPAFAQEAMEQIAAGVEYLHSRGVIHGMLMPSRILLRKEGTLLVTGSGMINLLQKQGIEDDDRPFAHLLSIADSPLCTPAYLAPEIVRGHPIDIRSDVYALGMLLFEMLCGRLPFAATAAVDAAAWQVQQSLFSLRRLCPDLPGDLGSIVNRALAYDPAQRFQHASELAEAFTQACRGIRGQEQQSDNDSAIRSAPLHASPQEKPVEEDASWGAWQFTPPIVSGKLPAISASPDTSPENVPLVRSLPSTTAISGNGVSERNRVAKGKRPGAARGKGRRAPLKRSRRMSRRQALALFATGGAVAAGTALAVKMDLVRSLTALLGGNRPMRPSFPRAASTGVVRAYTFEASHVKIELGGQPIATWAYNGMLPGPEIRLTEGDTLRVTVKNRLPEGTTIHWHGVPLVNSMDGVPGVTQQPILPGQDFVYTFVAPAAGTYLYHSHAGLQLDRGLYGPLIIEPKRETLNYDNDFVVVFDDWLDGMPGTPEDAMKQLIKKGDSMGRWKINDQVFDKADPVMVGGQSLIRFQFDSQSMMPHPMHLHGHFFQVDNGTGRGPLKDTVLVDPRQRLTINWVSDNPGAWAFHCHNRYHENAGMMRVVKVQ